ncbi:MAG: glycosyltransferase family 2 protein, partial [Melioribacteraceae bacterium]|nr:glycosyltransferase family 2 protein [Melioribacteraceae bacterium]
GSTDNSCKVINSNDRIIILNHENNLGKGSALKTGFEHSISIHSEITVTIDADNQHDPVFIPDFIKKIEQFDCVIGNRLKSNSSMPIHRRLSNYLTSKILSIKIGGKILDSQSGFRAFRTNILTNVLPVFSGFEAESEMIVNISKNNYSIGFTEISTIYGEDESKMKAIPTILGFIKVIIKT